MTPCVRAGCPGVEPWFRHQAQATANACVVLEIEGRDECRSESTDGFVCTLSTGHDGDHFAFQIDGGECDRWDR